MTRQQRWWLVTAACVSFAAGFLVANTQVAPAPAQPGGAVEVSDEPPCVPPEGGYVGLHEGKVVVYEGAPWGCRRLVEETGISVADLPAFQQRELEAGIPFRDDGELFQIIEGLLGP